MAIFALSSSAYAEGEAPTADQVIDQLLTLDPVALVARIGELKSEAATLEAQSAKLRKQAETLDAEIADLTNKLEPFLAILKALAEAEGLTAPPTAAMEGETAASGQEASAPTPVNYADDMMPIIQARCIRCHNDDRQRGGFSLATFANAMEGGSSGEVIVPGQADVSRMFKMVSRLEEPYMPNKGDPLLDEQIETIRRWIENGALPNAGAKAQVAAIAEPDLDVPLYVAAEQVEGPPPMPDESKLGSLKGPTARAIAARAVAASPTAPLLAVGGERQILLYSLDEYRFLGVLPFPEGDPFTLSFSVNGEILLAGGGEEGYSGRVVLWEVRTANRIGDYGESFDTVLAADISPDHKMVAVGGPSNVVRVYSTTKKRLLYRLDAHTDWIYAIKFSPDGELLATADRAGNLLLWQAANGRTVAALRGHEGAIHDLAYTHDSNVLASAGSDGKVILWDTWKYSRIRNVAAHTGPVLAVDFNTAGDFVSSGVDGIVKRWDLQGSNLSTYESLGDWAYRARFDAAGEVVLAGSWTGEIAVWQRETGERLASLSTNPAPPDKVAASVN